MISSFVYEPQKLVIHENIQNKLNHFQRVRKIPNLIFHGPSGSGKKTLLNHFIHHIYNHDREKIKKFTMYVNCAFGKGIKFIREELKFFTKTNIQENIFKCIILLNADKLTVDAQSALRRCIEVFNYNTRFFIVIEDKYKLLKPILSRFCEIYVPRPIIDNEEVNLHQYHLQQQEMVIQGQYEPSSSSGGTGTGSSTSGSGYSKEWLKKQIKGLNEKKELGTLTSQELMNITEQFYEKGVSCVDLFELVENPKFLEKSMEVFKKYEMLLFFHKVKQEFRNEKLMIFFFLHFLFMSSKSSFENVFFM